MGDTRFVDHFSILASHLSSWAWPKSRSVRFRCANKWDRGPSSGPLGACMQAPKGPDEGPRSHLLAHRKRTERLFGQAQLDKWDAKLEKWSTKRVSPISNLAFENG